MTVSKSKSIRAIRPEKTAARRSNAGRLENPTLERSQFMTQNSAAEPISTEHLPTTGPAGTDVQHHPDCVCEGEDAPSESPAIMWDERTVLGDALDLACFMEISKRLKSMGHPASHYRRERWNDAGQLIGPDLAVRSCEVSMAWLARESVGEFLDEMLPGSKR